MKRPIIRITLETIKDDEQPSYATFPHKVSAEIASDCYLDELLVTFLKLADTLVGYPVHDLVNAIEEGKLFDCLEEKNEEESENHDGSNS